MDDIRQIQQETARMLAEANRLNAEKLLRQAQRKDDSSIKATLLGVAALLSGAALVWVALWLKQHGVF